jgi:hypothetical protein
LPLPVAGLPSKREVILGGALYLIPQQPGYRHTTLPRVVVIFNTSSNNIILPANISRTPRISIFLTLQLQFNFIYSYCLVLHHFKTTALPTFDMLFPTSLAVAASLLSVTEAIELYKRTDVCGSE